MPDGGNKESKIPGISKIPGSFALVTVFQESAGSGEDRLARYLKQVFGWPGDW